MIIDTHAHYEDEQFDIDREKLLGSFSENGIERVIDCGSSIETSRQAIELSEKYDFMNCCVGVHPSETAELNEEVMEKLSQMADSSKVVAIGEIGLDYHYPEPSKEIQMKWFKKQLEIARIKKLPVVIHSRDAAEDTYSILQEFALDELKADIHCYSYSPEMAAKFIERGCLIGVGGVITFKNARKLIETVRNVPLTSILLETDCPYMAPEPNRGTRNSSLNLKYVIARIADIKGISADEVIKITNGNAKRFFDMK